MTSRAPCPHALQGFRRPAAPCRIVGCDVDQDIGVDEYRGCHSSPRVSAMISSVVRPACALPRRRAMAVATGEVPAGRVRRTTPSSPSANSTSVPGRKPAAADLLWNGHLTLARDAHAGPPFLLTKDYRRRGVARGMGGTPGPTSPRGQRLAARCRSARRLLTGSPPRFRTGSTRLRGWQSRLMSRHSSHPRSGRVPPTASTARRPCGCSAPPLARRGSRSSARRRCNATQARPAQAAGYDRSRARRERTAGLSSPRPSGREGAYSPGPSRGC